jgi:hypothetical protein
MSTRRTFVRRVSIGRPISNVNEAASGVVSAQARAAGNILINNASTNLYQSGDLVGSHGIVKFFDSSGNNIVLSVDSDELKAIIDSDYVKFITGQSLTRNFVDSAYVEQNSLDSERGLNLFNAELGQLSVSIVPQTDSAIDLGSASKKFRKLFLSGSTIELGTLSISDSNGNLVVRDNSNNKAKLDLSANSTNDLKESDNLYYTRARFDSALGDTTSRGTIRGYINLVDAGGDGSLTYDSAGGKITYTGPSASEVRAHINVVDAGGDGSFTYDSALGKLTYTGPSAAEVRAHLNGGHGIVYSTSTGNISVDSSEIRGLFSAGGDLTYNSGTGQFTFDVESVYTQANFESDLSLSLNATNGIAYDSASHKLSLINTGVDSGTYGSSTRVPILRIQSDGRVDSAGSVLVAGVTGVSFDSSTETITISTADGNTFSTAIGGYDNLQATNFTADSAVVTDISGSSINYDSGSINQFTATNITADSAVITDISGTTANYPTIISSQLSADSASITTIDNNVLRTNDLNADSAVITAVSGSSLNYVSANIGQLDIDSAETGNLRVSGNLTVAGETVTVSASTLTINDPLIHLADSNEVSDVVDIGFIGHYYRDAQRRHTGLFRDASNDQYYLFRNMIDSAFDSSIPPSVINRSATDFTKADLNVGNLLADSATMTNLTVTGLSTTSVSTSTLSRAATVDSGVYGSATLIPVITVNTSGFIDSIGTTLVAGVTGFSLDSQRGVLTISTADGGSFSAPIHSRDSAELFEISGSSLNYDSGSINQFTATNITADSAVITDISGTSVNVTTGLISQLSTDSAYATRLDANIARVNGLSGDSSSFTNTTLATTSLGGTMTVSGGKIVLNDGSGNRISVGTGEEGQIYHNSNNSYYTTSGGALVLGGDTVFLTDASLNVAATINPLTDTILTYNKVSKFRTTSTGVQVESVDSGSAAEPELILYRNSGTPADGDYLGQIQFKGKNDANGDEIYAKVTGKIRDATQGTEDGLIETAIKGNGGFVIVSRQRHDELQLLNSTGLSVDGNTTLSGDLTYDGSVVDSAWVGERARVITSDEIKFVDVDAGAGYGPKLVLDRNSSSPADSDAIGYLEFRGRNDADSEIEYGSIQSFIHDATADTEDGELQFRLKQIGVDREKFALTPRGFELGVNEKLYFQSDSGDLYLHSASTGSHNLLLPDSSGTLLTRDFVFDLIDSAYVGARVTSTGLEIPINDSAGNRLIGITITQAATIATGSPIGFGNTITILDKDSAEVTISL